MVSKFGAQFSTSRMHHLTSIALVNLQQEKVESLRFFMERFGKEALNIRNLNSNVAMHHMVMTLKPGPFFDSLCKKPTTKMDELRQRVAKFMQLEELKEFRHQVRMEEAKQPKPNERVHVKTGPLMHRDDSRIPKFSHYTPLNADQTRILEEALNADIIPTPRKILSPPNTTKANIVSTIVTMDITQRNVWP